MPVCLAFAYKCRQNKVPRNSRPKEYGCLLTGSLEKPGGSWEKLFVNMGLSLLISLSCSLSCQPPIPDLSLPTSYTLSVSILYLAFGHLVRIFFPMFSLPKSALRSISFLYTVMYSLLWFFCLLNLHSTVMKNSILSETIQVFSGCRRPSLGEWSWVEIKS